jgi:hypothetical protein
VIVPVLRGRPTIARVHPAGRTLATAACVATLLLQAPAVAAGPTTAAELGSALCAGGGSTIALSADILDGASGVVTIAAPCTAVLDLDGSRLQVNRIVLDAGTTLTIRDAAAGSGAPGALVASSNVYGEPAIRTTGATLNIESGSITANGSFAAAGIGGRFDQATSTGGDAGTINISGGTVTATSVRDGTGNRGAAIGGGSSGGSGTITISGGTVVADAETADGAAGIGAGRSGAVGTITISGGTVTAKGGQFAAGIGGGGFGSAGTILISGGDVTAVRGAPVPSWFAIGGGTGESEGTVTLGPGALRVDDGGTSTVTFPSVPVPTASNSAPRVALTCVPSPLRAGALVSCTIAGGDPGSDILWRAAADGAVFAAQAAALDASGSGTFTFMVPDAALGAELTVELVEWQVPISLGVVGGPVPTSVPSGGGPGPVWPFVMLAIAGGLVLRRASTVNVRG